MTVEDVLVLRRYEAAENRGTWNGKQCWFLPLTKLPNEEYRTKALNALFQMTVEDALILPAFQAADRGKCGFYGYKAAEGWTKLRRRPENRQGISVGP